MDFASTPRGFSCASDPRQNNFDLLRFLFASLVVFSHSYSIVVPKSDVASEPLAFLTGRQVSLGTLSVYGFFVISGFLIAQSWTRSRTFGQFLKKRALRLYPGFAVMTLFCAFVAVPLAKEAMPALSPSTLGKVVYRTVIFDGWEDPAAFAGHVDPHINASAWTIPYEFWCYLLLAGIGAAGLLRWRWGVAGLFIATYALLQVFAIWDCGPVWADWLPKQIAYHASRILGVPAKWPEFLTYFLAGTLFFRVGHRLPHSRVVAALCLAGLVVAARVPPLLQFVLPVLGIYLLFWLALHPALRFEQFGARGDFSYGIYLYAFPIQQLLIKWIGPSQVTPMQLFALAMPLSLVAGVLSWHGVEKWFIHRRRKTVETIPELAGVMPPADRAQAIIGLPDEVVAELSSRPVREREPGVGATDRVYSRDLCSRDLERPQVCGVPPTCGTRHPAHSSTA